MNGPILVGQLIADAKLSKFDAPRVAMLAALAEAGRPLVSAATAAGLTIGEAQDFARRFAIDFADAPR